MDLLGNVSLGEYALVAGIAFLASILGGVAGYGTGLILPPILLPIVGPEAIVPIISVQAMLSNTGRILAFRKDFQMRTFLLLVACALPTCLIGAWGYTFLSGTGITLTIGLMLIVLVPMRRALKRANWRLDQPGLVVAGTGYGLLVGGTAGSGVVMLSILLAAGMHGAAIIATDAGIAVALSFVKVVVFQSVGVLSLSSWVMALLIGLAALPGAFIARRLVERLHADAHVMILDAVVVLGGLLLVIQSLRALL